MTLVLSCLSPQWVMQVSDRRLTYRDRSLADDDTTKAVLLHNAISFGYTGLAELPRATAAVDLWRGTKGEWVPTHQWLTEVLAIGSMRGSLDEVFELVRAEADISIRQAVYRVRAPTSRRHAFIGVGWTRPIENAAFEPFVCLIDNFRDITALRFAISGMPLGRRPFLLHASSPLAANIAIRLERNVRAYLRRSQHPKPVARLLQAAVRSVAGIDNRVGAGLLLSCLPRQAIEDAAAGGSWGMDAGEPNLVEAAFLYSPAQGSHDVQVWPGLVLPGGKVFVNASSSGVGKLVHVAGRDENA